jgi:hypothetical protein
MQIIWRGSPNYDTNRTVISKIVCHWFGAGTLESADSRFLNPSSKASAHYGISGTRIYQWVREDAVAYHAGNYEVNQCSIGIEHDGNPDKPVDEETYRSSARLIASLCVKYNIPLNREHIIKHSEVKATQCPGTLDLDKLIGMARAFLVNDQTKLPIIDPNGNEMEVQAVRSVLAENRESIRNLNSEIDRLVDELDNTATSGDIINAVEPLIVEITSRANLRPEANKTSEGSIVEQGTRLTIIDFEKGEEIDGNPLWWRANEGYVWSGATNTTTVPEFLWANRVGTLQNEIKTYQELLGEVSQKLEQFQKREQEVEAKMNFFARMLLAVKAVFTR